MSERWITITEISQRTGLSRPTVYKKLESGEIPGRVTHFGYSRVERSAYEVWEKTHVSKDLVKNV